MSLRDDYLDLRHRCLEPWARSLEAYLGDVLSSVDRIDRISVRAKGLERFLLKAEKANDGVQRYADPLADVQDQIAARVVVLYSSDIDEVRQVVLSYFRTIETRRIAPEHYSQFGYEGFHQVLLLPTDVRPLSAPRNTTKVFELQIKTVFQHAWSEAEHDLVYKAFAGELDDDRKRLVAFAAAQAWGADRAFDEALGTLTGRGPREQA